jgi:gliding motility-associated-like protein
VSEVSYTINGTTDDKKLSITFNEVVASGFFIPEGFSPDGDGVNDTFVINGIDGRTVSMKVYNRWGTMVYESKAYKNDWEGLATKGVVIGEKLPDGTYFYAIDLNDGTKPFVRYMTIKRK